MSLKRQFCHSLPLLSPAVIETLMQQLDEEEQETVTIRCKGVGLPREFWIVDVWGKREMP